MNWKINLELKICKKVNSSIKTYRIKLVKDNLGEGSGGGGQNLVLINKNELKDLELCYVRNCSRILQGTNVSRVIKGPYFFKD